MAVFTGTDRYEVLKKLGQGGMGAVYAVFDQRRQRKVALKVLSDPETGSVYRFKREFRAMADLRHPNLVRLYDLGVLPGGGFFFTMELIEGLELAEHLNQRSKMVGVTVGIMADTIDESTLALEGAATEVEPASGNGNGFAPPEEVAKVLGDVVSGLDFLHRARKVHRDLKPSNVVVDFNGRAKVLDFGILRDLEAAGGLTGHGAVGTPLYMAPESVAGEEITAAADLYSLGCLLYFLLTGTPPFTGTATKVLMRHLREAPPPPSSLRACDERLERLCLELLEKDPAERPESEQILETLWEVAGEKPSPSEAESRPPQALTELIGRERELTSLRETYEEAVASKEPRILLIGGTSGVGKSALANEFAQGMHERVPAWFGNCYEREHVPYKAFDAIVDEMVVALIRRGDDAYRLLPPETPALVRLFPVLREVPAIASLEDTTGLQDPQAQREQAGRAFLALLTNLSNGAPPILVVDDLQRSDAESLLVLSWLHRSTAPPACLLVGTYRSEEVHAAHPLQDLIDDASSRLSTLRLEPLDHRATEELARAHASTTLSETQLKRLVEDANGNPFLAVELARASRDLVGDAMPTVAELVTRRLAAVGDDARSVLEAAAVAGGRATFPMLAAASGLPTAALADSLDELLRVQLLREVPGSGGVDAYDLAHDRLREAVYDTVPAEQRRKLHRDLAEHLAAQDDAARAVEHWRQAGEPEQAREAALAAAISAESKLAFDRAAELYTLAAQDGSTWTLEVSRANALRKAGNHGEAAAAYDKARALAPATQKRELALGVTKALLAAGQVAEGLKELDDLLRSIGSRMIRSQLITVVVIFFRLIWLMAAWFSWDMVCRFLPPLRPNRRQLEPDADTDFRMRVFDAAHHFLAVNRPLESARFGTKHAMLARRFDDPMHQGRARLGYALFLVGEWGRIAHFRAHHHLTIGEALCSKANDAEGLMHAHMVRAFLYLLESNWEGVERLSDEAEQLAAKAGLYGEPTLLLLQNIQAGACLFSGDIPRLVRKTESFLRGARVRGNVWGLAWPLSLGGYGLLLQGDAERGRAMLEEAMQLTPSEPLTVVRVHVELQYLQLYVYDDQPEEGLKKLEDLGRRWRKSGLVASTMENSFYRLLRARLRLLIARRGESQKSCHVSLFVRRLLPAPTSIRDEMLRLEAAACMVDNRPRRALSFLDLAIRKSQARNNLVSLGVSYIARARVREHLDHPGADLDRDRGERILEEIGCSDVFLLKSEGWLDPFPSGASCKVTGT